MTATIVGFPPARPGARQKIPALKPGPDGKNSALELIEHCQAIPDDRLLAWIFAGMKLIQANHKRGEPELQLRRWFVLGNLICRMLDEHIPADDLDCRI